MDIFWGILIIIFGLVLCWGGQIIVSFFPKLGTKLQLIERESDVDPAFYADLRGEALWDSMILWTLPVAGILLLMDNPAWTYFGLIGGGSYMYFAGRGILARIMLGRKSIRIGSPGTVKTACTFLSIWGLIGLVTIIMAVLELPLE